MYSLQLSRIVIVKRMKLRKTVGKMIPTLPGFKRKLYKGTKVNSKEGQRNYTALMILINAKVIVDIIRY